MIDKDLAKRKLLLNQQELERLKTFERLTIDEIAKNPGDCAACERYLERLNWGIPPRICRKDGPSAGLRNALVHEYNHIDPEMLQKSVGEAIREYNEYAKYLLAFIDKE